MDNIWKATAKQFLHSKSGVTGLVMIAIILVFTIYSLLAVPQNVAFAWNNPQSWTGNPISAAPAWVSVLGVRVSPSIVGRLSNWQLTNLTAGVTHIFEYNSNLSFTWISGAVPQDALFIPEYHGTAASATVSWSKPDGKPITIQILGNILGNGIRRKYRRFQKCPKSIHRYSNGPVSYWSYEIGGYGFPF